MTIWSEGFKVRSIPPLEENEAITRGADLLGEAIVFGVSVSVVVWEYNRSNEKAKAKEEKRLLEIEAENDEMDEKLHALDVRIEALERQSRLRIIRSYILGSGMWNHRRRR